MVLQFTNMRARNEMRAGMIELERSAQSAELASSAAPRTARACGSRRNAMRYLAACPVCAARPLFLTARHIQRGAPFLESFPATGSTCLCKIGKCKIKRPLAVTCRNSSTSYGTAHSCARGSSPCSERTSTGNDFQQQRQKNLDIRSVTHKPNLMLGNATLNLQHGKTRQAPVSTRTQ